MLIFVVVSEELEETDRIALYISDFYTSYSLTATIALTYENCPNPGRGINVLLELFGFIFITSNEG